MMKFLQRVVLGDQNAKEIRRHERTLEEINALADEMRGLSDDELRAKTGEFKEQVAQGAELDEILVPAFAVAREAAERAVGMRPFDVQIIGGIVLHQGKIAEMKTGEGKTLVAVLPAYLNALTGNGVHIVTVNDYLAKRDSEWMGKIFNFLGLSVGLIVHDMEPLARKQAYASDITYGTNNELGFDYLRDNMVLSPEEMVHRGFHYAIVDEVDSILIDEARTPLIISGPGVESTDLYYKFAQVVRSLKRGTDYTVDEKARTVAPTEEGVEKVEKLMNIENLYADAKTDFSHYLMQALKAEALMKLDKDYVVKDGEVIIVDEFTGRLMFGRRYSDGLHQAIEAKENVKIESENQTLATITFQNYFRMYEKLAGMTGTAATEEEEFRKIYGLEVVVIPTNKPLIREELPDLVYGTEKEKFDAVVEEIKRLHEKGQPVLVGTISIEKSEVLSRMLDKKGIPHKVLNAKHHEKEAEIVAQAGQPGAVTIATNMAGRGTDIVLGEGVAEKGGLHIIGTERHESRRIDNQLRGRSGRQGDPGSSRFYVSLEDDLMRIFGSDGMRNMLQRMGLRDGEPLEHPMLTRSIETAQKRVESRNFDMRKNVLEYDDVMNVQRELVYSERRTVLQGEEDLRERTLNMVDAVIDRTVARFCPETEHADDWNLEGLLELAETIFLEPGQVGTDALADLSAEEIANVLKEAAYATFAEKEKMLGPDVMNDLERIIMLRVIDEKWMAHLSEMDDLREGIGLRAYGQMDPLVAYKQEAYEMFQAMSESIQDDVVRFVYKSSIVIQGEEEPHEERQMFENDPSQNLVAGYSNVVELPEVGLRVIDDEEEAEELEPRQQQFVRQTPKVGRNDLCPCGSGKKYKRCHGAKEA